MEKFIPYEKLSKKEKRKIDQARRQTWGELNPVTRKPENSKAYNRNKARDWKREYHESISGIFEPCQSTRNIVSISLKLVRSLSTITIGSSGCCTQTRNTAGMLTAIMVDRHSA